MFKLLLCIYALSIALPMLTGICLAVMTPGRKLSFLRGLLAVGVLAMISLGIWFAMLVVHFTPAELLDFFRSSLSGDVIYQDVLYLSLTGAVYTAIAIITGFLLRKLVYEDAPGISRLQENMVISAILMSLAVVFCGYGISEYAKSHILIKEVHGDGSFTDAGGIFTTIDYIKIENQGACPVDLRELYLSDKTDDLKNLCVLDFEHDELLFAEWKNFAEVYLSTCSSHSYRSTLFGFLTLKDDVVAAKIAKEIDSVTRLAPRQFNLENECKKLREIMIDAYISQIKDGEAYWNDYIKQTTE